MNKTKKTIYSLLFIGSFGIYSTTAIAVPTNVVDIEIGYEQSELRLNNIFSFLKQKLSNQQFSKLKSEQLNWLKQRKRECGGGHDYTPKNHSEQACFTTKNQKRNELLMEKVLKINLSHDETFCKNAMTTVDVNSCSARELQIEENRMNLYLYASKARHADDAKFVNEIQTAQDKWVLYSSAQCRAVYTSWGSGSIRNLMNLDCRKTLTQQRTHTLWRDFLTYMDSTTPILAEPKQ